VNVIIVTAAAASMCADRFDGAHVGEGDDGRVDAIPYGGIVDGITSIILLSTSTTSLFIDPDTCVTSTYSYSVQPTAESGSCDVVREG
jgi:hypothetical protein